MLSEIDPMATTANWNDPIQDYSAAVGWWEQARGALKDAAAAFSLEQWQPWRFRVRDRLVELLMGAESMDDPDGREGIIRCGVALQTLKLSLKRQGCLGRVNLFPELDQPSLIARVHVSEPGRGGRDNLETGGPFDPPYDPGTAFYAIQNAVAGDRCWLEIAQCERSRKQLAELAGASEGWLFKLSGAAGGGGQPTRLNDGQKFWLGVRLRLPTAMREGWNEPAEASGTFAVLKTKTDDKHGWIMAGQTMALLRDAANRLGVACTFFKEAVRQASTRQELRRSIGHKGFGQVIAQLRMVRAFDSLPMERAAISPRSYS